MKKLLLLFATIQLSVVANAYDFTDNGIFFDLKSDGSLEVTGLASWTTRADILSDVTINGTTYQVTSIGAHAFEGRSDITYLSIPWSVTSIGEYAFVDCGSNLTVNIADPESWCKMELGNEHSSPLSSAGKVMVHDIETTNIVIPEGVTSIGNFTFYQCRCIRSLTIPSSVNSIGSSAFEDCIGLTSLALSEGLQSVGGSAFQGCTGLKTLTIPSTVKTISINAFANCSNITDVYCYAVNVPETHFDAFDATPTEKSTLHVPANAVEAYKTSWPWSDFKNITWVGNPIKGVFEVDGISYKIGESNTVSVMSGKSNVSNVVIPNQVTYNGNIYSVTSIHERAFSRFYNLTSVSIPNSITSVEEGAFIECSNLASIIIPYSVTFIGRNAFYGTAWYNNHPDGLVYAGKVAYKYKGEMPANTYISMEEGTLGIAGEAFFECSGLTSVTIPNSVTSIGDNAFRGCSFTSVVIPNSVKSIGENAFLRCGNLTSVAIGSGVVKIEDDAFSGCNNLKSVHISDLAAWCNINYWGEGHYGNPLKFAHHLYLNGIEIRDLIIPQSVISISHHAFSDCTGLSSVTIPNSVTSIGGSAFSGCTNLTTIVSEIEKPFKLYGFSDYTYAVAKLIVPFGTKETYQATEGWNKFQNIVEADGTGQIFKIDGIYYKIGENNTVSVTKGKGKYSGYIRIPSEVTINGTKHTVTSIDEYAFEGGDGITYLSIPSSVKSIGEYAFIDCGNNIIVNIENLEAWWKIKFGNEHSCPLSSAKALYLNGSNYETKSVHVYAESIPNYAFYQCRSITSLNIYSSVKTIGSSAFEDCTGLKSITFNEGLESIGGSSFEGCSGLSYVVIPSTVTSISINAFKRCSNLRTIVSKIQKPYAIDESVFGSSPSTLIVPKGKIPVYRTTLGWMDFTNIIDGTSDNPSKRTIHVAAAGTLPYLIHEDEKYQVEELTLTGELNGTDFKLIRDMAGVSFYFKNYQGAYYPETNGILRSLDLLNTNIVEGGDGYVITDEGSTYYNKTRTISPEDYDYKYTKNNCISTLLFFKTKLKLIILPYSVTAIEDGAFLSCSGLTSIDIPKGIISIGSSAFSQCSGLTTIVSEIENPFKIDGQVFYSNEKNIYSIATLIVPKGKKAAYQATEGWNKFANIFEVGDVNGDNKINNDDLNAIVSYIMGKTPAIFNVKVADLNNDGKVNVADVTILVKIIKNIQ